VTDVVRGADLLDSTAAQIHLQRLLGLATPRYLHVPGRRMPPAKSCPSRRVRPTRCREHSTGIGISRLPAPVGIAGKNFSNGLSSLGPRPPAAGTQPYPFF